MVTPPEIVRERVAKLLERGLERYGAGNLLAALSEWEHALALDPDNATVGQYVSYVRDNFAGLDEAFRQARIAAEAAQRDGVPLGDVKPAEPSQEDDDYTVEVFGTAEPSARVAPDASELDTGWAFDALAALLPAPLPPPPEIPVSVELPNAPDDADAADEDSFGISDLTSPRAPAAPSTLTMKIDLDRQDGDEAQTTSRGWPHSSEFSDVGTGEHTNVHQRELEQVRSIASERSADDSSENAGEPGESTGEITGESTREHTAHRTWAHRPPGERLPSEEPSVAIDDDLLIGTSDGRDEAPTGVHNIGKSRVGEELQRDVVLQHIQSASAAMDQGDGGRSVQALEQAFVLAGENSQSVVVLHRHRDLMLKIYESYLGDPHEVPVIAIPVHELSHHGLDHRAAFLLSRVDGTLTFEEILDIAGMPRLDAYRLLAGLVLRGILEFR